jgi:predicted metal-dependent hydrolase
MGSTWTKRRPKVVVRVPKQASNKAVSAAIESKRFWIWQKIRDTHKYPDLEPRKEYVAGETFLFLGQHYPPGPACRSDAPTEQPLFFECR